MTNVVKQNLHKEHTQLMQDIELCSNMFDIDDPDRSYQENLIEAADLMVDRLGTLETVMTLKETPDCGCFY